MSSSSLAFSKRKNNERAKMPSVLILSSKISFFLSTFLTNFRAMVSAIPIAETSRILAITFDATVKGRESKNAANSSSS